MKTKIYVLCDEVGLVRYVGKTSQPLISRLGNHLYDAKRGVRRHLYSWVRSLIKKGPGPTIHLISEVDGNGEEAEMFFICWYRMLGAKLVNATDGGEGMPNPSEETRKKLSLAHKGRKKSPQEIENIRKSRIGKKHSEEARRNMSLNWTPREPWNKGKKTPDEVRAKVSINNGHAKLKPEEVLAIRNDNSGISQREIGARYGVSGAIVSEIRAKKIWKYI